MLTSSLCACPYMPPQVEALRGSDLLGEVVMERLLIAANGKQVFGAKHVTLLRPRQQPVPAAAAAAAGATGAAKASAAAAATTPSAAAGGAASVRSAPRHTAESVADSTATAIQHRDGVESDSDRGSDLGGDRAETEEEEEEEEGAPAWLEGGDVLPRSRPSRRRVALLGPVLDEPLRSLGPVREAIMAGAAGGASGAAVRREARRQAARGRFQLPPNGGGPGMGAAPLGNGITESAIEEEEVDEEVVLVPVEVVMEEAVLCVPHDESPTRIYELSEVWGEAVEQVCLLVCLTSGARDYGR